MSDQKDTYLTIVSVAEGLYKEKGSKFIAYAYPVVTEEKVKEILATTRKKYYDAHHHCYAFMLGAQEQHYRANDDGEPAHSAGDPILGQIRSHQLTNVLVIVIRYFGGTKLGVSGLMHAYKTATADALAQAQIIEKVVQSQFTIYFDYVWMNQVMKLVKEYDMEIISQHFAENGEITLGIRQRLIEEVKSKFALLDVILS